MAHIRMKNYPNKNSPYPPGDYKIFDELSYDTSFVTFDPEIIIRSFVVNRANVWITSVIGFEISPWAETFPNLKVNFILHLQRNNFNGIKVYYKGFAGSYAKNNITYLIISGLGTITQTINSNNVPCYINYPFTTAQKEIINQGGDFTFTNYTYMAANNDNFYDTSKYYLY